MDCWDSKEKYRNSKSKQWTKSRKNEIVGGVHFPCTTMCNYHQCGRVRILIYDYNKCMHCEYQACISSLAGRSSFVRSLSILLHISLKCFRQTKMPSCIDHIPKLRPLLVNILRTRYTHILSDSHTGRIHLWWLWLLTATYDTITIDSADAKHSIPFRFHSNSLLGMHLVFSTFMCV